MINLREEMEQLIQINRPRLEIGYTSYVQEMNLLRNGMHVRMNEHTLLRSVLTFPNFF